MKPDPYQWYRDALDGKNPPITTTPECGFFLMKNGRGTFLPASIYWQGPTDDGGDLCGDEVLHCEVGGYECDPEETWLRLAKRPISREEYQMYLTKMFAGEQA